MKLRVRLDDDDVREGFTGLVTTIAGEAPGCPREWRFAPETPGDRRPDPDAVLLYGSRVTLDAASLEAAADALRRVGFDAQVLAEGCVRVALELPSEAVGMWHGLMVGDLIQAARRVTAAYDSNETQIVGTDDAGRPIAEHDLALAELLGAARAFETAERVVERADADD